MAKTKVEYIVVVSILTFVSIVITLTSVSTQQWIYAEPESNIENATFTGYGYYGLFAGEWYIDEFEPQDIKIVCIVNENICGWSYEKNSKNQLNEIEQLYSKHPDRFLNAGLYIVTVCFIFISLIISGVTIVVSLLNIFTNPTNDWIGVYGLKILNIVTPCFYLLTLIMWAVEYQVYIIDNIAVKETIEGTMTTKDLTSLNYSYWIILIPMFLHVINIGVLYYRDYQINKQPTAPVMETDPQKDGIIFLY